jgi:hypothetical protein
VATGSAFSADVDTRSYMQAMRIIGRDALPRAVAAALNAPAEAITRESRRNVERRMIVRTRFTLNSIRQDRTARGRNFRTMHSRVGSISPYLAIQDEGGTIRAQDQKIPIPTLQARTSRTIQRSIARRYRMNAMGTFSVGSQFFMGRPRGGRRTLGIWERHRGGRRIRLIRNLEHRQVRIKPTRWYSDAVARYGTQQFIAAQFHRAAERELRRAGAGER